MSFAQVLLENVVKVAEQHGAKRVKSIQIAVGNMLMLNPEQLRFCFDVISRGTIAEDANLEIEVVKAKIRCMMCGKDFDEFVGVCDECGGIVTVEGGKDMILKKVEMEV